MTEHWNEIITFVGTALAGAFGVGVGYSTLRESIRSLKDTIEKYRSDAKLSCENAETLVNDRIGTVKERLLKLEGKVDFQVGKERCDDMRSECSDRICVMITDLSRQVSENRHIVVESMKETQRLMGRVEQILVKNGFKKANDKS